MEADMLNIIVSLGILLVSITAAVCSTVGRPVKVTVPVEEAPVEEAPVEEAPAEEEEAPAEDREEGEPNGPPPGGDGPDADEMTKPELDYLKAQLEFYREEMEGLVAKMRNPSITMSDYTLLKKHWDGLYMMITELEEVIA
jgi:hypothetical protein